MNRRPEHPSHWISIGQKEEISIQKRESENETMKQEKKVADIKKLQKLSCTSKSCILH